MEKIIEIDLNNKYDYIDKYNEKKISNEIIQYIINQSIYIEKQKKIRIVINRKCEIDNDLKKLLTEGLIEEYNKSIEERSRNNKRQLFFLILGVIFIFFSTLIKERTTWRELLLITGWVPIWEMIEVELFPDDYGRKKRRAIKKLLNSEIVEKI